MRKFITGFIAIVMVVLILGSCESKKNPPELPPYESMAIDFSKFDINQSKVATDGDKSTEAIGINYTYAAINVAVFSTILSANLAVPVTCFQNSFSKEPTFLGDGTWQWNFDYPLLGGTYHARLTGEVRSNDVKWEMNISRDGIGAFNEFMWYEGTSLSDGSGGQWILKHSQQFQEPLLQIDWERTGTEIGMIKYTNVRELENNRTENVQYGAYIEAGLTEGELDAYYNIHVYDIWTIHDFADINIEWSTTTYNGRVKSPLFFTNVDWHCWDGAGADMVCE
jgi:hypothetical protein